MANEAPPAYRAQEAAPPSYSESPGNVNLAEPPPAAFGQCPPNLSAPIVVPQCNASGGETFDDTNHSNYAAASPAGSGEAAQRPQIVLVMQHIDGPQPLDVHQPGANGVVLRRFEQKLRSISFFGRGRAGHCGWNLMGAVWTHLFIMLIAHSLWALCYLLALGLWSHAINGWQHFCGLYVIINIVINYGAMKGLQRCDSAKLRNQANILAVTFPLSFMAMVLEGTLNHGSWHSHHVVMRAIVVVGSAYLAWLFREVYRWAFYFEHGGLFEADSFKAPLARTSQIQQPLARADRGPQDGNL